jgi:hypothetical protein
MQRPIIILLILFFTIKIKSQDNDYWFRKCDTSAIDNCGYTDKAGNIEIPFGKYFICFTDTFKNYAIVLLPEEGFIGIDKHEKKLFTVYPIDNGPDYISDGTFRITENNKVGIADTSGSILIKPIYDFTFGFKNGLAIVNIGGHKEKVEPSDPNSEYIFWSGGKWGVINKQGKIILDLKYNYEWNPATDKSGLTGKDEKYEVVDGRIIVIK